MKFGKTRRKTHEGHEDVRKDVRKFMIHNVLDVLGRKQTYKGTLYWQYYSTPFGTILLAVAHNRLCWLNFVKGDQEQAYHVFENTWQKGSLVQDKDGRITLPFYQQIFSIEKPKFGLLFWGSEFDVKVWKALLRIPHGQVVSYQDVAYTIGQKNAVRAVGQAVGRNRIAIVVPCHRVIRKNGQLGGYRGQVERKRLLLEYEKARLLT